MTTALERVAILVAALALAVAVIALLSGGLFTGSDKPNVARSASGPGEPSRLAAGDPLRPELRRGDVALIYGTRKPPPGLRTLAHQLAPPLPPSSGQAIILSSRRGVQGIVGVSWDHLIRVSTARDPRLRAFVNYWLGRAAPDPGRRS